MKWFVSPETVRLDIGGGEWIEVKKELTKGEKDKANAMVIKEIRQDGRMTPDFEMMSKAEAFSYLVDWSLKDDSGKTIAIENDAARLAALNGMSEEGFDVISKAVADHVKALEASKPEKKGQRGVRKSSVTSASAA